MDYKNKSLNHIINNQNEINNNNKKFISQEKEIFNKKIDINKKFLNKIQLNKDKSNLTVEEIKRKINIIDISQITKDDSIKKKKIIHPKELLPDIIKDYYNGIKSKGFLSFISKIKINSYYTRKTHNKYGIEKKLENKELINNDNYKNNSLPKIISNPLSNDKIVQVTKTFIDK